MRSDAVLIHFRWFLSVFSTPRTLDMGKCASFGQGLGSWVSEAQTCPLYKECRIPILCVGEFLMKPVLQARLSVASSKCRH